MARLDEIQEQAVSYGTMQGRCKRSIKEELAFTAGALYADKTTKDKLKSWIEDTFRNGWQGSNRRIFTDIQSTDELYKSVCNALDIEESATSTSITKTEEEIL